MRPVRHTKLGASGILVNQFGDILLGKRAAGEELSELWCTPGGGVNYRETIDDCLRREYMEETGLLVRIGRLVFIAENLNVDTGRPHSVLMFKQVYLLGGQTQILKVNRKEFSEVRWISRSDLGGMKLTHSTYRALCVFYNE